MPLLSATLLLASPNPLPSYSTHHPFLLPRSNSPRGSPHRPPSPRIPTSSLRTATLFNSRDVHAAKEVAGEEVDDDDDDDEEEVLTPPSAAALAAAIRRASPSSPVKFKQRVVEQPQGGGKGQRSGGRSGAGLLLPSPDFQRLCLEQLELFRMVVHRDAVLSVYVRPAGSYVMSELELCRVVTLSTNAASEYADCVILAGSFALPGGLRAAESFISKQEIEVIPEHGALVLPMIKQPFVVGFIVMEYKDSEEHTSISSQGGSYDLPPLLGKKFWEVQSLKEDLENDHDRLIAEQKSKAIMISRSLATAYVMDQKAMLLQQSSWQNSVRMSHLIEQIGGPLSSIRALTKMLSLHVNKSEVSCDIVEDIMVQGDYMKNSLEKLQEAVYLTKANIVRYNEIETKKMGESTYSHQESLESMRSIHDLVKSDIAERVDSLLLSSSGKDIEMPMPPLWLMPLKHQNVRPYIISNVLEDLVAAAGPLANDQQRSLEFIELPLKQQVVVEESALRQALSNLIEGALLRSHVGGRVQIYSTDAPAGGALVIIEDDGPDMHYMTQTHSLAPFGADLFSDAMIEDNMAWNFVAGIAVAREILESYGCVMRVISPRSPDAALGTGGTRIEIWFPALHPDSTEQLQEV